MTRRLFGLAIVSLAVGFSRLLSGRLFAQAATTNGGIHILDGRVLLDDRHVDLNLSVTSDRSKYLFFHFPSVGLFIISDGPFEGATEAGAYEGRTLAIRVGGHVLRIESSSPILCDRRITAWAKFD